jgi:hypothetical protein
MRTVQTIGGRCATLTHSPRSSRTNRTQWE